MSLVQIAIGALVVSLGILGVFWVREFGVWRGVGATLCRLGWSLPIILAFFPETATQELPRSVALRPIHILIDDSKSMSGNSNNSPRKKADEIVRGVNELCPRYGCEPKIEFLSHLNGDVEKGLTPLAAVVEPWLHRVGGDPWLLVSDGGDSQPVIPWDKRLRNAGKTRDESDRHNGMIVGFAPSDLANVWVDSVDIPPFSFESKPLNSAITLQRASADDPSRVQVQVLAGDQALATANAEFAAGSTRASVPIYLPPIARGYHLLTVRALPTAAEKQLWDNTAYTQLDVLPNTIGVLHLLGSPSWDGRFMRRYFKSEPKYDLISFFILRDPWDMQQANERELSLIPFPVERLFREELANFRVLVIQNFTMFQFLLPEYQNNLVKFVQNGGALLFVGGPRSLQQADLVSTPLKAILPFEIPADVKNSGPAIPLGDNPEADPFEDPAVAARTAPRVGPVYDPEIQFQIELAQPDAHKRALANVYDDWELLGNALGSLKGLKGMHRTDRVQFKEDHTPLLVAKTADGQRMPLAVASYPGKGRALWLFSDNFWRFAMDAGDQSSRQGYQQFTSAAMAWLMRQDMRKPLIARDLILRDNHWRVTLQGPATRYFRPGQDWRIVVCGAEVKDRDLTVDRSGADDWELAGTIPRKISGGELCAFEIVGEHAAFGSVKSTVVSVYPETYPDSDVGSAPQRLRDLAQLTGAKLILPPEDAVASVGAWIETIADPSGIPLPGRFRTTQDHFWVLNRNWFWLLLVCMPFEVLLRCWHKLAPSSGRKREVVV